MFSNLALGPCWLIETLTKGLGTSSHEGPSIRVCHGRRCLRTAFPWCIRTIHSTRVQPLRRHPAASAGRNSGIRHQSAVSRDHSSRIGLLKLLLAACHGGCSNRPLKSGTGTASRSTMELFPKIGCRIQQSRQNVTTSHDRKILRHCSSVLSSSLTEISPSGHCERVVTASHASSRCDQHPTTFDPSIEPPSRSREILLRPLSPSAVFESRGRHNHAPRSLLPGNHRGSGVSS